MRSDTMNSADIHTPAFTQLQQINVRLPPAVLCHLRLWLCLVAQVELGVVVAVELAGLG
jgi:hypothetical protein